MQKRKYIEISLALGLVFSILLSMSRFDARCEDLRRNVLRLHIIANSDSYSDQKLKLKIRDKILETSGNLFENANNLEEAEFIAHTKLKSIEKTAQNVIIDNGFSYKAKAKIENCYFENREYDDFTLPAGEYPSLIIELGKAEGHNWWCVLFPTVCISAAAKGELSDSADKSSAAMAENPQKFTVKFKTVEIYEDFKHNLKTFFKK